MGTVRRESYTLSVRIFRWPTAEEIAAAKANGKHLSAYSKIDSGERLSGTIEIEVDMGAIAKSLGERALRSTGRKAVIGGGLVTVRARDVKRRNG